MIPICFCSGDPKEVGEAAFQAAVSRPIAGRVSLSPNYDHVVCTDSDGGVTRTPSAQWDPNSRNNLEWVRASAAWARANQKGFMGPPAAPETQE